MEQPDYTDYQYESLVSWYYIENSSNYPGPKGRVIPDAEGYDDPSEYEGTELYIPKGTKGYKEYAGNTSHFTDYEGNSVPFKKEYFKLNPNMTNEQLRMQMLSGIITEGEYKAKLQEDKSMDFSAKDQKDWSEKKSRMYDSWANSSNELKDLEDDLKKAKGRDDKEEIKRLNNRIAQKKITIKTSKEEFKKLNESKDSLNEHYVAGGIVGIGAITQIPSREKTDYEMAFEHFLGERYLTKFENREQDLEEGKEEEDLDEGKEVEEPSLYEEEVSMDEGQSISQIQDEWLQVTTDIARLAAEYKKPKPDMQAALALGDQLKAKARLKQKLENEINNSIAGNDRDIRLIITQLT